MRLVVDASVVVKLLVDETDSGVARQIVADCQELHAPRLMVSEVANTLWRKACLGQIERPDAWAGVALLADMPMHWNDDETVGGDAVRLSLSLDHPAYDCIYLALALRIGATVVTADSRFVNVVTSTEHGESILMLADYANSR